MPGQVGNPNHDPSTGKFTSASGLNVANSTRSERIKASVKEGARASGEFAKAVAAGAVTAIAGAALAGVTKAIRRAANEKTAAAIEQASMHVNAHAKVAAKTAIHAVGKAISAHSASRASQLKSHIQSEHSSVRRREPPRGRTVVIKQKFPYKG